MTQYNLSELQALSSEFLKSKTDLNAVSDSTLKQELLSDRVLIEMFVIATLATQITNFPKKILSTKRNYSYVFERDIWKLVYDPLVYPFEDHRENFPNNNNLENLKHAILRNIFFAMKCDEREPKVNEIVNRILDNYANNDYTYFADVLMSLPFEHLRRFLVKGNIYVDAFQISDVDVLIDNYKSVLTEKVINYIDYLDFDDKYQYDDHKFPLAVLATDNPNIRFLEALVDLGADINAFDTTGMTALMMAIAHRPIEYIKSIFNHGADVNMRTNVGNALHALSFRYEYYQTRNWRSADDRMELLKLLLEKGANPKTVNSNKETLEDLLNKKLVVSYLSKVEKEEINQSIKLLAA